MPKLAPGCPGRRGPRGGGARTRRRDAGQVAVRQRPVAKFVAEAFARRKRKAIKQLEKIDSFAARRRHKLRIAVKKLRYACAFFAGVFGGGKRGRQRQRFAGTLKKIQTALGTLNDIEVHKAIAAKLVHRHKPTTEQAERAFAIGFVAGEEQRLIGSCLAAAKRNGRRLAKLPPFWR
jgi:triphosphatase